MDNGKAIGIDIGGTSIKGIVIDRQGIIHDRTRLDTDAAKGRDHILGNVRSVVTNLLAAHRDVSGIGIGTAGRVNVRTGEIDYATDNLPGWQGTNLKTIFEEEAGLPVCVDNDANTALIGEMWLGAGEGCEYLTMLTLGTGVGGANMVRGELVRGARWNGGEWGHVIFVPGGRPCNCGQSGCIEQYLSGTAFVKSAQLAAQYPYRSGIEVIADFERGHPPIVEVVRQYVDQLATVIHNIHLGLNPQAILIGGGLVNSQAAWWGLLSERIDAMRLDINVKAAKLGNEAGSIGAAKMILR